jgi:signal peptidase I
MTVPPGPAPAQPAERSALREWTRSIIIAVVIWLVLRAFVVEAFRIPSGSMENTLLKGDFLFVNKAVYGPVVPFTDIHMPAFRYPRRNDIVVFDSKEQPGMAIVKRLIGVPGDTISMRAGQLYRNGKLVPEPYAVNADPDRSESPAMRAKMREWQVQHLAGISASEYEPDLHDWGPLLVPPDSLFMMGDNRDDSYDSRYWGFLAEKKVRGTPLVVYYSYNPDSWKSLPFISDIRWGRLLHHPQ